MDSNASSEYRATIEQLLREILSSMGFAATVQAEDTMLKGLVFNIDLGDESYLLIGHRGVHLHALEVIVQAVVARRTSGGSVRFSLDVDDYRQKREWYIKETVRRSVQELKRIFRPVALEPMPNYERKLVHALVQASYPEVVSTSSGMEPHRRVIIKMKNQEVRITNQE